MDVSPNVLRKETAAVLKEADTWLTTVRPNSGVATEERIALVTTLLLTKAQCLNTLALLNEKKK